LIESKGMVLQCSASWHRLDLHVPAATAVTFARNVERRGIFGHFAP